MSFGQNLQYLRRQKNITQENLAEKMKVSRQTVSKWEADEGMPEMKKLIDLCDFFSCKLDELVREDMTVQEDIYSTVCLRTVKACKLACYVMITPNPESDVNTYMDAWAKKSNLYEKYPNTKKIGWDFPFVTAELQNRFGLRGYAAAFMMPEEYERHFPGVEVSTQEEAVYAVISITDPFQAAFERIPNAYKKIMQYLQANGFKENSKENVLPCFEYKYEREGVTYMDVYVHADGVVKANMYTSFS